MKKKEGLHWRIVRLLDWPKYLIPALLLWTFLEFLIHPVAGITMLALDVAYVLLVVWWILSFRKHTTQDLVDYAKDFSESQKAQMLSLPVPYAVLDARGELVWANYCFEDLMPDEVDDEYRTNPLRPFLENSLPQDEERVTIHIRWNDREYKAEIQMISSEETTYSLFLFDETEHKRTLQNLEDEKAVMGFVSVDNYDELMNSLEQVRQAVLTVRIERKLISYFSNFDAIVSRTEKDKYVVFMSRKGLNAMMEDHFKILEEMKPVNTLTKTPVTLSISMATGGTSLGQIHEFARNAMDLALGRGGDQAVVKTPEFTKFYGGKSQPEKNVRTKARVKAQALKEIFMSRETVVIMGHRIPDSDAFGAAVGIYRAARLMDKKAHIVMGEIPDNLQPMVTRFRTSPDYPTDMIISSEKAMQKLNGNAALVVVDVNRPSYTEAPALLEKAASIVLLDHHRQGGESIHRATLSYVETYASSTSEMVTEILQYLLDDMKLSSLEAEALYSGIVVDTNNFLNKTGVRTFETAAFLRRCGADVNVVRKLFRDPMESTKARAAAVSRVELFRGCFAFSVLPSQGVTSPTVVCAQAANDMLDIVGVKASFVLTGYNDQIYISARSIDEINVQLIMERLGGGGHLSVAGAQLKNTTIEEAKHRLQDTIVQMMNEGEI